MLLRQVFDNVQVNQFVNTSKPVCRWFFNRLPRTTPSTHSPARGVFAFRASGALRGAWAALGFGTSRAIMLFSVFVFRAGGMCSNIIGPNDELPNGSA